MAVFDRDGDGTASGMEVGRTLAEAGLWHDSLGGSGGGSGSGPRGSEPGCSCSGCLIGVGVVVLALVLLYNLLAR